MGKNKESTGYSPAMGGILLSAKTRIPIAMGGALHTADIVADTSAEESKGKDDPAEEEASE